MALPSGAELSETFVNERAIASGFGWTSDGKNEQVATKKVRNKILIHPGTKHLIKISYLSPFKAEGLLKVTYYVWVI